MSKTGVIAFSGGLDTSFIACFAREQYQLDKVITCTVDTGGFSEEEKARIAARAKECGVDEHIHIEAEEGFYQSVIKHLIFGNVTRDGYPLSVGSERLIQASKSLEVCLEKGAEYIFHGSTGAGNDQYRFDVAIHVLGQGKVTCVAPVREHNFSREYSYNYLRERGVSVQEKNSDYSYNVGLWGVSIGGKETHTSSMLIPDTAWYSTPDSDAVEDSLKIVFEKGEPVSLLHGKEIVHGAVKVIKKTIEIGNRFGIGKKYHVGTSIPGKKGRLAYEAPAAEIIYEAHRTLEKLVLTQNQIQAKQFISNELGRLIHEAKFFDPYLEDLQAFLESSQRRVSGEATIFLKKGFVSACVADSPYNLLAAKGAVYGETAGTYSGAQAEGATKLHALEQMLYRQVGS